MSEVTVMFSPVIDSVLYDVYINNSTIINHKIIQWYNKPPTCFGLSRPPKY